MSAFSSVVDAVVNCLRSPCMVADVVEAEEVRPVDVEVKSLVNVYWKSAIPEETVVNGPSDWQLLVIIDGYARSLRQTGARAIDEMMIQIVDRIAADSSLTALVIDTGLPRIDLEFDESNQKTGWVQLAYTMTVRTSNRSVRDG